MKHSFQALMRAFVVLVLLVGIAACGRGGGGSTPDGVGYVGATPVQPVNGQDGTGGGAKQNARTTSILSLNQATVLRYIKSGSADGVLEVRVEVPAGTQIAIPTDYQVSQGNYRTSDGAVAWSSTGFISDVTVVKVPEKLAAQLPPDQIDQINQTPGGLYVFASILGSIEGIAGDFLAVLAADPGAGFLKYYEASGKPKFTFSDKIRKRWGAHVNRAIDSASQAPAERTKWQRIYMALKEAADRAHDTPKSFLMIDLDLAKKQAAAYEKNGVVSVNGAWTIAVQVTAPAHGFANTPCAEFMSEMVREAYARAGYNVADDFNTAKGNRLIWSDGTAAVVNFSNALDKAGWVPWDSTEYRPITGAVLMNEQGQTPGHTYMAAGDDGRIIMDNGAPQGRDLRKTTDKTIDIMFKTGVFFLPPGIIPPRW